MVNMGQALHDQLHDQLVPHLDWALTGTGTARYCTLLGQALHYYRLDLGQAMHAHSQDSLGRDPGQDAIRDRTRSGTCIVRFRPFGPRIDMGHALPDALHASDYAGPSP